MKTLKKTLAVILSVAMVITLTPSLSFATDGTGSGGTTENDGVYVLMNIPYAEFYQAELGDNGVDSITSATKNGKARNVNVNGSSYHQSEEAVTTEGIAGATYPVKASSDELAALKAKGAKEITDADKIEYEMTARGQTTQVKLEGAAALQESPSYSYYVLSEAPDSYKELNIAGDGTVSFGKVVGDAASGEASGKVTVGARHADIEIALSGVEADPKEVSGVVVTTDKNKSYALHHVVNIWRGTEIGWNLSDMNLGGDTITNIRYFMKDGTIKDYQSSIAIADAGYVLMNIPYDKFYDAETGEGGTVDAVSTATLKYANSGIAGGSYHDVDAVNADSQVKALGVTYPVFVADMSKLDSEKEIKDSDAKTIGIVTGREKTITPTEVTGKDILFCAPDYSWYKLNEKPARYKTMNEDGSFSAVSGRASAVADVTGAASYNTHHGNYVEIRLSGELSMAENETVSGVIVTFDDGSVVALPHIQGFWRKTQIGWAAPDSVAGKTITGLKFITTENVYDCSVNIPISEGGKFLSQVKDEYQPLFEGATFNSEYDHYWHDYAAAVVGGTSADETVAYMKTSIGAKGYGDQNEAPNFFCGFTNDVAKISFGGEDGKTVTFTKKDGTSTTRTYEFVKDAAATGKYGDYDMAMNGYLYKAKNAEENDPFAYLLMFPDTPDTTYHLEFRYGDTEENVCKLLDGPYGYWVGSAIQTSALTETNEDTLQKVISLFVVENLVEMQNEETNAQRKGLVGTWDCDFSAFPQYANAKMYIVLSPDGTGKTYADFTGSGKEALTAEYTFFAYDPDSQDGKDGGTYIALNEDAETVTPGEYEIKTVDGKKALVFTSNEGEITYFLREQKPEGGGGSGGNTEPQPVDDHDANCPSKAFDDLDTSLWYHEGTDFVIENKMMNGVSDTKFAPNDTTTRAMIVTILWRQEGEPDAEASSFTDVEAAFWYEAAVNWAAENKIVNGMSETSFAPMDKITREQLAAILYRYAEVKGADVSAKEDLSSFTDVSSVSDWAEDALGWAVQTGLMKGVTETTLQPQGNATRAQAAVLMQRLCENILK